MEQPVSISDLRQEWRSIGTTVLRHLWTVLAAGLLALCCLLCHDQFFRIPSYSSYATLAVQAVPNEAGTFANLSATAAMAEQYAFVFHSDNMLQMAADEMALERFPAELTVEVTPDLNLLTLYVTAETSDAAVQSLTAILQVYPKITDELFSNATLQLVSPPTASVQTERHSALLYWLAPVLAALLQGLLLILWALLRPTVRQASTFQQFPELPCLGLVCHSKYSPLLFREDLKKLATRLETRAHSSHARIISVTSPAPRTGCSTVSLQIAVELAERGETVALLTACPPVFPSTEGLTFLQLPSDTSTLSALCSTHSLIIADIPFNSDSSVKVQFWKASDDILLVTKANSTTISSVQSTLELILQAGGHRVGGIINQTCPALPKHLIQITKNACTQGDTPHANNHSSCSRVHL